MLRSKKKTGNLLLVFLPLQKTQTRFERVFRLLHDFHWNNVSQQNETNTAMASYIKTNCIMSKKERIVQH